MNTGIVILAAGAATRMGSPKQLLTIEGKSLIKRITEMTMETTCFPIVVVLGANRQIIRKELDKMPITIIENQHWEKGMSSSMKMGLAGIYMTQKEVDAVIFLTVDMPFVSADLISQMKNKALENVDNQIVACKYDNQIGIPVLFKRELFTELLELSGDEGAKKVVMRNKDKLQTIDFPEGKYDLDTIEDYRKFVANFNNN